MTRIFIILLALFNLCPTDINSQELLDVKHLMMEDGLTERMVNYVLRDSFGFFYLISETSIQRYDGESFEKVNIDILNNSKTKPGLVDYFSLSQDGKLVLTIPHVSKLFYISPGELKVSSAPLPINGSLLTDEINWFIVNQKDNNYEIHEYEIETAQTSLVLNCTFHPEQIIKYKNKYFVTDSIATYGIEDGLKIIDENSGTLIQSQNSLYKIKEDTIYYWQESKFISIYQQDSSNLIFRFHHCDSYGNLILAFGEVPRYIDKLIVVDNDGKIHIISDIPKVDNIFKDIYADNAFTDIMTVGYDGVHIFKFLKDGATHKHKRELPISTFGYIISGIAINNNDEIVYCTESKGLYKLKTPFDSPELLFENYKGGKQGFHQNSKLYFSKENELFYSWSYTFENKSILHLADTEQNKATSYTIPQKINDIQFIDIERILIGGYDLKSNKGQLSIFNITNKEFEQVFDCPTRIYSIQIRNGSNQYWIGTMEGLFVLDSSFNLISKFSRYEQEPLKLLHQDYIRTTVDYGENVVVGTVGGGVYIIDPDRLEIIKHIDKSNGLTDNNAIGIIEDDNNNCWISTWNGLNVMDSSLNLVKKFYQQDCLPDKEFNTKAVTKDKRGFLYFGTINGLLILDPVKALSWKSSAGLFIDNVIGYNSSSSQKLDHIIGNTILDSILINLKTPDYFKYPFGENNISASSTKKDDVKITSYQNTVSLYDLKLTIDKNFSIKNNSSGKEILIPLEINYDYANLLRILGLIAILWLIAYVIILRQKQKEQELDKFNKKIAALELSALQSQMNPHFMFNAIGAIQYYIQTHDVEKADGYLSDFAMLMRNILESSKSKFITIRKELEIINLYIRLENIRYDNEFEYEINIDDNVELETLIPPMIIQPLVENAIVHGLSPLSERKGKLSIDINICEFDFICFSVTDNGIGREAASKHKSLKHKSQGMQIIKDRVEAYNHRDEIAVEFTIIDLIKSGRSIGTKAILKVKDLD